MSDYSYADDARDIAEVPAVEVITTVAVHLMSAAAVKLGLSDGPSAQSDIDLDEARKLVTVLAGFVTAAAPEIGDHHARPLRDGLRSLQLAFREASVTGGVVTTSSSRRCRGSGRSAGTHRQNPHRCSR